jgi:hypothetical protein
MRRVGILVVALAVAASCCGCKKLLAGRKGPSEPVPEVTAGGGAAVAGNYAGAGTNPDGGTYACDVTVAERGNVYRVMWYFDGELGYEGTGILKGNTFVVGYAGPQGYGVVAYTVKADGSLDGTWTGRGATNTGTEKLTRK